MNFKIIKLCQPTFLGQDKLPIPKCSTFKTRASGNRDQEFTKDEGFAGKLLMVFLTELLNRFFALLIGKRFFGLRPEPGDLYFLSDASIINTLRSCLAWFSSWFCFSRFILSCKSPL